MRRSLFSRVVQVCKIGAPFLCTRNGPCAAHSTRVRVFPSNCAACVQLCCLFATYFQATVLPVCNFQATVLPVCNLLPSNCAACVQLLSKQLCCLCATSKQLCCLCATVYLSEQAGPNQHSHDGPTRLHAPQVVCLAFKFLL